MEKDKTPPAGWNVKSKSIEIASDIPMQLLFTCKIKQGRSCSDIVKKLKRRSLISPSSFVALITIQDAKHIFSQGFIYSVSCWQPHHKWNPSEVTDDRVEAILKLVEESQIKSLAYTLHTLSPVSDITLEAWKRKLGLIHASFTLRWISDRKYRLVQLLSHSPAARNATNVAAILRAGIEWLATQEHVHFLEPALIRGRLARNGAARQTTQGEGALFRFEAGIGTDRDWRRDGSIPSRDPGTDMNIDSSYKPLPGVSRPGLSQFGLNGNGEIISIGDTGLDFEAPFFKDADERVEPFRNPFDTTQQNYLNEHHRKVLGYWSLMDDRDYLAGHGTHVTGTALGDAHPACRDFLTESCSIGRFNGMAPAARVIFVDLQCNTPGGCACGGDNSTDQTWCPCTDFSNSKCPHDQYLYPPEDLAFGYLAPLYALGARINSNSWGSSCSAGGWCATKLRDIDTFVFENDDMLVLFAAGNDGDDNGFSSLDVQGYNKNGLTVGASRATSLSMAQIVSGPASLRKPSDSTATCTAEGEACLNSACACPPSVLLNCSTACPSGCSEKCWSSQFDAKSDPFIEVDEDVAYFSSIGPTSGGRWKPDVISPGYYIASAKSYSGNQPSGDDAFCGIGGSSLSGSSADWILAPNTSKVGDNIFSKSNCSGFNNSFFVANQIEVEQTHSLSALSATFNFSWSRSLSAQVTAAIFESSEYYGYEWSKVANVSVRFDYSSVTADEGQIKGIFCHSKLDDLSNVTSCRFSLGLVKNLTLWAGQKYLVGFSVKSFYGTSVQCPKRSVEISKGRNGTRSCFGWWLGSHFETNLDSYVCMKSGSTDTTFMAGSFYPISLHIFLSPRDALRNHLQIMAGTSMATPNVAGNAAIVRQYYTEAFFVNASKTLSEFAKQLTVDNTAPSNKVDPFEGCQFSCPPPPKAAGGILLWSGETFGGFKPSAPLVKATLINGASGLAGVMCTEKFGIIDLLEREETLYDINPKASPQRGALSVCGALRDHPYEGFGRISLADSLAIVSDNNSTSQPHQFSALRLEVPGLSVHYSNKHNASIGRLPFLMEGEEHSYCFTVAPEDQNSASEIISWDHIPIQATLTWVDPVMSPAASHYLAHNLDLELSEIRSGKEQRYGDADVLGEGSSSYRGYSGLLWQEGNGRTFYGNNDPEDWPHEQHDTLQNVEKIRIFRNTSIARKRLEAVSDAPIYSPFLETNAFEVRVLGAQIAYGPQSYALVVTGPLLQPIECAIESATFDSGMKETFGVFALALGGTLIISIFLILSWVSVKSYLLRDSAVLKSSRGYGLFHGAESIPVTENGGTNFHSSTLTLNPMNQEL